MYIGGHPTRKQLGRKGTWGSWWILGWTWATNVPLTQRRQMVSWAALGGMLPAGQGTWSFPSNQHWWDHTWSSVSSSGLHISRKTMRYHRGFSRGYKDNLGSGPSHMRRNCRNCACLVWRRDNWERISLMHLNISKAGAKRLVPDSFQWWTATGGETMTIN